MHIISASVVGNRALAILRKNRRGAILSSHSSGFYCRLDDGSVLLVHEEKFGLIPFGLGCPLTSSSMLNGQEIPSGTPVAICAESGQFLLDGFTFVYPSVPTPPMPFPWESGQPLRERLQPGLDMLLFLLANSPRQGIAASFMRQRDAFFSLQNLSTPLHDMWEEAIWKPLQTLVSCLRGATGADTLDEALTSLIGLGPGLTPLADDILCGLLAAGSVLGKPFPCFAFHRLRRDIAPAIQKRAPSATTGQSAAYLCSAATGDRFGMLDALMAAIYTRDVAKLDTSLAQVMDTGHSSGSGLVLGVLCAMDLAVRSIP
jgi:hypothetical protein